MLLNLIIPTLNEAENIILLIDLLKKYGSKDSIAIIVVDGGSSDTAK